MEVKETAACGISEREFAIEFETDEIEEIYRVFLYAQEGSGFYDEDFLEDLKLQMSFIIGRSLEEELSEDTTEGGIHWEDTGSFYTLAFNETGARKLYQILLSVEHPGDVLDKELNWKLLEQMLEIAPNQLENLPVINR
jgi:hypothetical protein